jgi:hypothetical protein
VRWLSEHKQTDEWFWLSDELAILLIIRMYCNACLMILQEDNDLYIGFTTETFVGNGYVRIKCNLTKSQN